MKTTQKDIHIITKIEARTCYINFWALVITLMVEAVSTSEMSANLYELTRCHIPEDSYRLR
jgi:hypothetical protein